MAAELTEDLRNTHAYLNTLNAVFQGAYVASNVLEQLGYDRSVDPGRLAQQMEGFSAAQIRHVVDAAAMAALEADAPISDGHFQRALQERIAEDRYGGAPLGWDDLILPEATRRKLQSIERFIENPQLADELGVDLPTGALLHGPPGTGKTTIARVLASQTDAAFFTINRRDETGVRHRRHQPAGPGGRGGPPAGSARREHRDRAARPGGPAGDAAALHEEDAPGPGGGPGPDRRRHGGRPRRGPQRALHRGGAERAAARRGCRWRRGPDGPPRGLRARPCGALPGAKPRAAHGVPEAAGRAWRAPLTLRRPGPGPGRTAAAPAPAPRGARRGPPRSRTSRVRHRCRGLSPPRPPRCGARRSTPDRGWLRVGP
ncbi:MAG: AAA family ATPase [Candidatus Rokubacteria bacterium]|nr:AAA family ATPase [Candidatus Rokubacteria bacterium]